VIFLLRILLLLPVLAPAWAGSSIAILDRYALAIEHGGLAPSHRFALVLAYFEDSWKPETIRSAVRKGARILAQCGVEIAKAELVRLDAPARYRVFDTPISREMARALALPKPTIYFVAGTRQQPAFEAEAIGRANSGSRPELRDTVWVTRGARDLDIVLAHELAHVLMDSGEHSEESGNLMREDTSPRNTYLTRAQCTRLREAATSNGLLQPAR
jgi:Zn-dependent protease with chaperone function